MDGETNNLSKLSTLLSIASLLFVSSGCLSPDRPHVDFRSRVPWRQTADGIASKQSTPGSIWKPSRQNAGKESPSSISETEFEKKESAEKRLSLASFELVDDEKLLKNGEAPAEDEESKKRKESETKSESADPQPLKKVDSDKQKPEKLSLETLTLADVLNSVQASFPLLSQAAVQQQAVEGQRLSAMGAFDTNLYGNSTNQPLGFYQNYRNSVGFQQQSPNRGATVSGGYRIGDGDFPVWYKNRETNEGGEFSLGANIPLRKDRLIDPQRAALMKAQIDVGAFPQFFASQLNFFFRDAAMAYWDWYMAGNALEVQKQLTELALERAEQIKFRVEKGDLPELSSIDNDRLIAQRQTKLFEAKRKFQAASIKLSLFLRDLEGQPMLADESFIPDSFEKLPETAFKSLENDLQAAIAQHPELVQLRAEIRKAEVDRELAQNGLMGKLDLFAGASQDVGAPASPTGDKTPFELEAGLRGEVPLQRREARGKVCVTEAKLRQSELKLQFASDKLAIAIRDSYSAFENALQQRLQAARNKELADKALQIGKASFVAGDIDLIVLNIYEQAAADAELLFLAAEIETRAALVDFAFATGNPEILRSGSSQ